MTKFFCTLFLVLLALSVSAQERMVDVNGQHFRIKEFGQGPVTVVFEAGMSDSLESFRSIPDSIAKIARVFLYDRAGMGKSDTSACERSLPNCVSELRAILAQEKINPPYILVGHSFGGFITRYFISQYPDEVKGLLMLDPCAEVFWDQMSKKELAEYKAGGDKVYAVRSKAMRAEWEQLLPSAELMHSTRLPENMPVILVSATAWNWGKHQKKIIAKHKNARQVILDGSHYVHQEQPEVIIQYIRELVQKAI